MFTEQPHRQLVKEPRRVCARRRKESPIIFFGDMCGEENTSRPANVRAVRRRRTARALQSGRKPLCQKSNTFLTVSRGGKPPRKEFGLSFAFGQKKQNRAGIPVCAGARCSQSSRGARGGKPPRKEFGLSFAFGQKKQNRAGAPVCAGARCSQSSRGARGGKPPRKEFGLSFICAKRK